LKKNKKQIQFSGAHRPLYFLRDGTISEYKGNKKSIGGIPTRLGRREEKDFQNHVINYQDGDRLYIFSDGLPDQVGGPKNRKYQAVRMREKIVDTQPNTMQQVFKSFTSDFDEWQGGNKQIDDVLLIGIEL
jgi:serine phosphatase RsbU (regulator of sigma subunit)